MDLSRFPSFIGNSHQLAAFNSYPESEATLLTPPPHCYHLDPSPRCPCRDSCRGFLPQASPLFSQFSTESDSSTASSDVTALSQTLQTSHFSINAKPLQCPEGPGPGLQPHLSFHGCGLVSFTAGPPASWSLKLQLLVRLHAHVGLSARRCLGLACGRLLAQALPKHASLGGDSQFYQMEPPSTKGDQQNAPLFHPSGHTSEAYSRRLSPNFFLFV